MKILSLIVIVCLPVFIFSDFNPLTYSEKKNGNKKDEKKALKIANINVPSPSSLIVNIQKKPVIKNLFPKITSYKEAEKKITVLKNEHNVLPFKQLNRRFLIVSLLKNDTTFTNTFNLFANFQLLKIDDLNHLIGIIDSSDQLVVLGKAENIKHLSDSNLTLLFSKLNCTKSLIFFDNPNFFNRALIKNFDAIVVGFSENNFTQNRSAQLLFGAIPAIGKLDYGIKLTDYHIEDYYTKGFGIPFPWSGRLKFTSPEELGISSLKLKKIDSIALLGIKEGAYPGCQIVAAYDGKIFYRKSFGSHTYKNKIQVNNTDIFDLASITKIAASTTSLMYLESQNKFNVNKKLSDYLPELGLYSQFGNLGLKEILCHQSGLHPWIPFYLHTIHHGKLDPHLYRKNKAYPFINKVADSLYMNVSYSDTMFLKIKNKPLKEKKYKYSDLGYYYVMRIIEKVADNKFDFFVRKKLYQPMGLRTLCFNPLNYFSKNRIIPTENDTIFRHQLLQGYVHDMGAAMLGGVCGHAGLFGNATDLASLFQMFLNKGYYAGKEFIDEGVISRYTKKQYPNNHRAIGFDKRRTRGKSTCNLLASENSFGHSGFTGTLAWADPENKLNFVFLSNRVHPIMDNRKIIKLDTRREIQRVLYEAVKEIN